MAMRGIIENVDVEILVVILSALLAFLAWVFKQIVISPLSEAKETFLRFTEKRIESLSEISNVLLLIAFNPSDEMARKALKELSISSKMAYLDQKDNNAIIEIVSQKNLNETKVLGTIKNIQNNLVVLINEIRKDNQFYLNYSAISPWDRVMSYIKLLLQFIISIIIISLVIFMIIKLVSWEVIWGSVISIVILILVVECKYLTKYIKQKDNAIDN